MALEVSGPGFPIFKRRGRFSERKMDFPMTVLIYVDTSKQVGDPDHLKVFANADATEAWFAENDPEGVAFEYEVIGPPASDVLRLVPA
jgi:uncharacterized protein YbbC (DUF1343 family)